MTMKERPGCSAGQRARVLVSASGRALASRMQTITHRRPKAQPPITSLGQWTPRATRLQPTWSAAAKPRPTAMARLRWRTGTRSAIATYVIFSLAAGPLGKIGRETGRERGGQDV